MYNFCRKNSKIERFRLIFGLINHREHGGHREKAQLCAINMPQSIHRNVRNAEIDNYLQLRFNKYFDANKIASSLLRMYGRFSAISKVGMISITNY